MKILLWLMITSLSLQAIATTTTKTTSKIVTTTSFKPKYVSKSSVSTQPTSMPEITDANLLSSMISDSFFFYTFSRMSSSVPITIFFLLIIFFFIYTFNRFIRYRRIKTEVAKYAIKKEAANNTTVVTGGGGNTVYGGSTTVMTSEPTKSGQNSSRFDVNFDSAGIGNPEPTNMSGGEPNKDSSRISSSPNESKRLALPENVPEYRGPIFQMPLHLKMEFSRDVRLKGKMTEGGGGVIYKAEMLNPNLIARIGQVNIVVKVLKPLSHMSFNELKSLVFQEIAVMNVLSAHPNLITLVGYTEEPLSIITVQYDRNLFSLAMAQPVYASQSSDLQALKNFVKNDSYLKKGLLIKGFEMLPEIALHIAYGMAAAMNEMHLIGILHRDLKSANVLLEYKLDSIGGEKPPWMTDPTLASMASKISGLMGQNALAGGVGWGRDLSGKPICPVNPIVCDFGLAKAINKQDQDFSKEVKAMKTANAIGISYRYAAPEAFNRMYHKRTGGAGDEGKPVDIYAFAIMCWELLERKVPFHKLTNKEVETKVKAGERPVISPQFKDQQKPHEGNKHYSVLVRLIEKCWKQNPQERPSFLECKQKLKKFWLGSADSLEDFATTSPKSTRLPTTGNESNTKLNVV